MVEKGSAIGGGDPVIFFNFRNDRPRELSEALAFEHFTHFERGDFKPATLTTMTEYQASYPFPVAFAKAAPRSTLGELLEARQIQQFHCAETEKYPHVTFFFNGGREQPFAGEERRLIASPDVATYDRQPAMSAAEVADAVIEALDAEAYGFIVVNFANGDMVGHTGVWQAAVAAVETLDCEVGRVIDTATQRGYSVVLTADHGNCDMMVDPISGEKHTQHTHFPVPCMVIDPAVTSLASGRGLASIAPTVLQLLGIDQPASMGGQSLLLL